MKNLIILLLGVISLSSCSTKFVSFKERENDIYPSQKLKSFLSNNPKPKVVIRVYDLKTRVISGNYSENSSAFGSSSYGLVGFGSKSSGSSSFIEKEISNDNLYNTMEKELMKSGFLVRDRHLFNQIISNNENNVDYSVLKDKTDTDLIIEVSRLDNEVLYETNKYYTDKGKEGILQYNYKMYGASVEFKVILIENNELAGTYTFNYTPCNIDYPCRIDEDFTKNWQKAKKGKIGYERVEEDELEWFIKHATNQLIQSMKN